MSNRVAFLVNDPRPFRISKGFGDIHIMSEADERYVVNNDVYIHVHRFITRKSIRPLLRTNVHTISERSINGYPHGDPVLNS